MSLKLTNPTGEGRKLRFLFFLHGFVLSVFLLYILRTQRMKVQASRQLDAPLPDVKTCVFDMNEIRFVKQDQRS